MDQELKALAAAGEMDPEKVEALLSWYGEVETKRLMRQAVQTQKAAQSLGISYKAIQPDPLGDAPAADDELTLSSADLEAIAKAVVAALGQARQPKAPPKLTDSGRQSTMPTVKAYEPARDLFAIAVGADQVNQRRPATKAAPGMSAFEYAVKHGRWDGR